MEPIKISFWQPIERKRFPYPNQNPIILFSKELFDVMIDPLYTHPLASTARYMIEIKPLDRFLYVYFQSYDEDVTIYFQSNVVPVDRMLQVSRWVIVVAGLILWRRTTVVLLAAGLALKYFVRSQEIYYCRQQNQSVLPTRIYPSPQLRSIPPEQQAKNCERWVQKWWCDAMFYLFAIGKDETIVLPDDRKDDETKISVKIGEDVQQYSRSFLTSLPFFQALLSSGMRDFGENQISLTEAFPFRHDDLAKLQEKLQDPDASTWGSFGEFDFLCPGMRQKEAPFVVKLGMIQKVLADKNYSLLPHYCSDTPPQTKMMSYSIEFLPIPDHLDISFDEEMNSQAATLNAQRLVGQAAKLDSDLMRYYCVNKIVSEYVALLSRRRDPNILELIVKLFESTPEAASYLTILDLPSTKLESDDHDRLLPKLFKTFPQLKWLSIELFDQTIQIVGEDYEKDFVEQHRGLRVLKIDRKILREEELRLKDLFPNLDILETYNNG